MANATLSMILDPLKCPTVSICTLTYNRRVFLPLLKECILRQKYPHHKIEWLILDDSDEYSDELEFGKLDLIQLKYQRLKARLSLGKKRNLAHRLCSGDIIVYMDDDDFYSPQRIRHAVQVLLSSGHSIAGCTLLPIYFLHDQQLWLSGPFANNHATAGTFAMTREFALSNSYDPEDTCNEERKFLKDYTVPMAQLDVLKTMICISHLSNTFDKKKMRLNGQSPRMREIQLRHLGALGEHFNSAHYLSLYDNKTP